MGVILFLISLKNPQTRIFGVVVALLIAASTFSILGCTLYAIVSLFIGLSSALIYNIPARIKEIRIPAPTGAHYFFLVAVLGIGAFFRFYNLAEITNGFEGELANYYAGSTSLAKIFVANKGIDGPWAPLGILFYLPIYCSIKLFGTTLYAVRFSSAAVGTSTILILYLVVRRIFNARIALIAAALFSLNSMHIGWSRTDIHPHGVTTWPALLIALASYLFFKKPSFLRGAGLAATMALCWHQYPSGQSAVAIPWLVLGMQFLARPSTRHYAKILPTLLVGTLLWYLGLPVVYYIADGRWDFPNPFTLTTQRASWSTTTDGTGLFAGALFVIEQATRYFFDFLSGLVYKATYLFHQDFPIDIPEFFPRTYPFLLLPFCVCGFLFMAKKWKELPTQIIFALLIAAILPGILAERPYPKRMSVTFATLDIISAIGIAGLYQIVTIHEKSMRRTLISFAVVCYLFFASWLSFAWFSGRQFHIGQPVEEKMRLSSSNIFAREPSSLQT